MEYPQIENCLLPANGQMSERHASGRIKKRG